MNQGKTQTKWQHLEKRPQREQLYLKGRRIKAFDLWMDMQVNQETATEVASNWDLSIEAVLEAIQYCETHQDLLQKEAIAERQYLEARGISLEPKATH